MHELEQLLDELQTLSLGQTGAPFQRTNRGLDDPRWVRAVLTLLKGKGFTFAFYTPKEERTLAKQAAGTCGWFKQNVVTGEFFDDRVLKMSSRINSLDALRVASHEMAHALTLDAEEVKAEFAKGPEQFMASDHYAKAEVLAEAPATMVACVVCPEERDQLLVKGAQYLALWRDYQTHLANERENILSAAATILVEAGKVLGKV